MMGWYLEGNRLCALLLHTIAFFPSGNAVAQKVAMFKGNREDWFPILRNKIEC